MKTLFIAEIGLNHLGNSNFLNQYLKVLLSSKIDGITIQILKDSFYKNKFKKFKINNKQIINFINKIKDKKKLAGIVTDDIKKIKFLKKLKFDFYKVLSSNINDIELVNKLTKTNCKTVFLSTGMTNINKLKTILKKVGKKKISLIHTSFKKNRSQINLNRINTLKKKFKLPISYGNHSKFLGSIKEAQKYKPYAIFFYVKIKKKGKFPDNIHAIELNKVKNYIY
mgnify:FL=1